MVQEINLRTRPPVNLWFSLVLVIITASLFFPVTKVSASDDLAVKFPDKNLQAAVREWINKPRGDIYQSDLLALTRLDANDLNISNLAGLEFCKNLTSLALSDNQITDISPLSANSGISSETEIYLHDNPLSETSINTYIPQLKSRGIWVGFTPAPVSSASLSHEAAVKKAEGQLAMQDFRDNYKKGITELDKKATNKFIRTIIIIACAPIVLGIIIVTFGKITGVFKRRH
jgi:hypothetical protein